MKTAVPLACAFVAFLLFSLGSGARGLWNPDEPREAEIAREMYLRGDPVVPHLNGEPFLEKPPLYAWLSGLAFRVRGGPDAVGARAVSNAAGAALVGLTVRLAMSAVPARDAALAGAALAGMPLFWWHSSRANLDIPLALFVGLAVSAFFRAWARSKSEGVPRTGRYHHAALDVAAAATALAVLDKGLVGLALPVLIVAAFLALERDLWFLTRLRWIRLTAILALPVLAWLVPFTLRDHGALAYAMFVKHHLERFVSGFDHQAPWWHYLSTVPTSTLPWLPLALPALDPRTRSPLRNLSVAWVLAPLLFFSASVTKRDLYMVPSFPAIALLVGLGAARTGSGARAAAVLTGLLALAIGLALGPFPPKVIQAPLVLARGEHPVVMPLIVGAWALGGVLLLVGRGRAAVAAAAVPSLLTAVVAMGWLLPSVDPLKSARDLLPVLAASDNLVGYQLREPDLGVLTFPRRDPIWIASDPEDLGPLLDDGKRIVGSESVLMPALSSMALKPHVVMSAQAGSDRFVIVEREPREPGPKAASTGSSTGRKVALTLHSMVH